MMDIDKIEIDIIISELFKKNARIEAEQYLELLNLKRIDLINILKKLDVPTDGDKKKLKERIIERTVGFRIRSEAIQEA